MMAYFSASSNSNGTNVTSNSSCPDNVDTIVKGHRCDEDTTFLNGNSTSHNTVPGIAIGNKPACTVAAAESSVSSSYIGPNDVLLGRGGGTNHHIGNRRFRDLVKENQTAYLQAKKLEKATIARRIVDIVYSRNGRFLQQHHQQQQQQNQKDGMKTPSAKSTFGGGGGVCMNDILTGTVTPGNGHWEEVSAQRAREKTSQALRENLVVRTSQIRHSNKQQHSQPSQECQQQLQPEHPAVIPATVSSSTITTPAAATSASVPSSLIEHQPQITPVTVSSTTAPASPTFFDSHAASASFSPGEYLNLLKRMTASSLAATISSNSSWQQQQQQQLYQYQQQFMLAQSQLRQAAIQSPCGLDHQHDQSATTSSISTSFSSSVDQQYQQQTQPQRRAYTIKKSFVTGTVVPAKHDNQDNQSQEKRRRTRTPQQKQKPVKTEEPKAEFSPSVVSISSSSSHSGGSYDDHSDEANTASGTYTYVDARNMMLMNQQEDGDAIDTALAMVHMAKSFI
jgi:hypothetical protein